MYGYIVTVELLQQSQWGTKSNALVDDDQVLPILIVEFSKKVMLCFILQRNW